ncbi:LysM peptidoglycan-binding domain-containing protein [Streptomyces spiramenti]|uniref:LysM peptidoglycan-binding domain-containing protein n=1 Tax=Streptomyces spiramenti TaxID=2720606 RepID=A0ABX1AUX6_9ACTN|nr:LysM peptidoglycan-binding domain-containing protein [Streptomyces spiramenti]NJP68067.1 LysM peptidoglycan-binding domain-containing protein [Streptomyces spiramenti]
MATFVTRAQWGGRARRSSNTNITPDRGGVSIHHVGGDRVARAAHGDCAAQVRGIQNYHMDSNGWSDVAYSHLVCVHGYVFQGRGEGQRTAANGTDAGNQNWYGVCALTGGSSSSYDTITDALVDAFHLAISRLRSSGNAASAINGHRDHRATECPGNLYTLVQNGRLNPGRRSHTVRSGETLYSIGRLYGVAWESIAATNNLSAPYTIYVGQVLVIPAS